MSVSCAIGAAFSPASREGPAGDFLVTAQRRCRLFASAAITIPDMDEPFERMRLYQMAGIAALHNNVSSQRSVFIGCHARIGRVGAPR